jgi:Na+/melibiose symporter-like transporter
MYATNTVVPCFFLLLSIWAISNYDLSEDRLKKSVA